MIRINLMAVDRDRTKRRVGFDLGQRVTLTCSAIFVAVVALVVWQALLVRGETADLDERIRLSSGPRLCCRRPVDQELATMSDVVGQRNEFEARSAELARRVSLIETLRAGQGGPVRMLDQVSRSLPDGVWLSELRQEGADITLQGRATSLIALSDLVAALESSGYFALPVTVVDSQLEPQAATEVQRFELRATFVLPPS